MEPTENTPIKAAKAKKSFAIAGLISFVIWAAIMWSLSKDWGIWSIGPGNSSTILAIIFTTIAAAFLAGITTPILAGIFIAATSPDSESDDET